jgi:hypothetical protein
MGDEYQRTLSQIGFKFQELRIKKGFSTCNSFSEAYDLPAIQYSRIEEGRSNLTLKSLMRVLQIHQLSLEDFICLVLNKAAA